MSANQIIRHIKKCVKEMDVNIIVEMFDNLKPNIHKANGDGLSSTQIKKFIYFASSPAPFVFLEKRAAFIVLKKVVRWRCVCKEKKLRRNFYNFIR